MKTNQGHLALLVAMLTAWSGPALAYLDPVTGSFIIQSLVAGIAAAIVTVKLYWKKIKAKLGFGSADTEAEIGAPDQPDAADKPASKESH